MRISVKSADVAGATRKAAPIKEAAVSAFTMAAIRDTEPLVPYVTGALRGTAHTESEPERGRLIYGSAAVPYARPQYYGNPNKTWPGTIMQWWPPSLQAHQAAWIRESQAAAREAAGR